MPSVVQPNLPVFPPPPSPAANQAQLRAPPTTTTTTTWVDPTLKTSGESSAEQLVGGGHNRDLPPSSSPLSAAAAAAAAVAAAAAAAAASSTNNYDRRGSAGSLTGVNSFSQVDAAAAAAAGSRSQSNRSATGSPLSPHQLVIAASPEQSSKSVSGQQMVRIDLFYFICVCMFVCMFFFSSYKVGPKQVPISYLYQLSSEPGRRNFLERLQQFFLASGNHC